MEALNRHVKNYHEKIRPFNCTVCPKSFSDAKLLENHITKTHPEEQKNEGKFHDILKTEWETHAICSIKRAKSLIKILG